MEISRKQFWKPMQKRIQVDLSTQAGCSHVLEQEEPLAQEALGASWPNISAPDPTAPRECQSASSVLFHFLKLVVFLQCSAGSLFNGSLLGLEAPPGVTRAFPLLDFV